MQKVAAESSEAELELVRKLVLAAERGNTD
jgi:hypothetical protein